MPVYIENVEIWSGVTDVFTAKFRATQLVQSLKFKLSHAMMKTWMMFSSETEKILLHICIVKSRSEQVNIFPKYSSR